MKIFSRLKSFFGCDKCSCERRMYTQSEVNNLCTYWKDQIVKAKEQVRKERSSQFVLPPKDKDFYSTFKAQVQELPIFNSKKPVVFRKKRKPCNHTITRVDNPSRRRARMARRRVADRFVKECCVYNERLYIPRIILYEIYLWWCEKRGYPLTNRAILRHSMNKKLSYITRRSISDTSVFGTLLKGKANVSNYDKKRLVFNVYGGVDVNPDIMKQYLQYKGILA